MLDWFTSYSTGLTKYPPPPLPLCVHSDLEQLRKIRRRSPHDDTEAFTVFLRSDVEAKSVLCFTLREILRIQYVLSLICSLIVFRAIDVWGSHEALARERNLRKEVEREYQESRFIFFPGWMSLWTSNNTYDFVFKQKFSILGNMIFLPFLMESLMRKSVPLFYLSIKYEATARSWLA